MANEPGHGYIRKIREETQEYVRRLLGDNETLRVMVTELDNSNARLRQEVRSMREEIDLLHEQEEQLRSKLQEIRSESESRRAAFDALELHNANLASLYVASYQLHGTLDRDAVLLAIEEIIVNLVGSEAFAILERGAGGNLEVVAEMGGAELPALMVRPEVAESRRSGAPWISADPSADGLAACVPLVIDGSAVGLILVCRLLSHKKQIEPLDHELFGLLATHAATALYCTSPRVRHGAPA